MAEYVYEGPAPHDDGEGGLVRPGEVREFDGEPDWGPWRLIEPEATEKPPPPPPPPPSTPASGSPPAASTPAPAPKDGM